MEEGCVPMPTKYFHMQYFLRSPKLAAQASAGLVFGLVMSFGIGAKYSRSGEQSEEKLPIPAHSTVRTAGLTKSTSRNSTSARATKRPDVTLPAKAAKSASAKAVPQITVSKPGAVPVVNRHASKARWDYLDRSVRAKIDAASVTPKRWKMIVIHSSATTCGSARAFDYYHRQVKHMEHGLAYHFVIGNGHGSGNGKVEVGPRWAKQIAGGHLRSDAQNEVAVGICLVGSFEKGNPTQPQLEALDELIDYLQAKLGKIRVTTHRLINIRPTLCPGRNFPAKQFIEP